MFSEVRWTKTSDCGGHCNGVPLAYHDCCNCHNKINDKVRITNVTKMSLTNERDDDLFTEINEANRRQYGAEPCSRPSHGLDVTMHKTIKHTKASNGGCRAHKNADNSRGDSLLNFSNFLYWLNTNVIVRREKKNQQTVTSKATAHKSILYQLIVYLILNVVCSSLLITSVRGDDDLLLKNNDAPGPADEWYREPHYTPTWAVHIPGGDQVAQQVADDHGYVILGKVS